MQAKNSSHINDDTQVLSDKPMGGVADVLAVPNNPKVTQRTDMSRVPACPVTLSFRNIPSQSTKDWVTMSLSYPHIG